MTIYFKFLNDFTYQMGEEYQVSVYRQGSLVKDDTISYHCSILWLGCNWGSIECPRPEDNIASIRLVVSFTYMYTCSANFGDPIVEVIFSFYNTFRLYVGPLNLRVLKIMALFMPWPICRALDSLGSTFIDLLPAFLVGWFNQTNLSGEEDDYKKPR